MSSSGKGWDGASVHIYWNQKHQEVIEEKKEHLEQNYDGVGDYILQKLKEEDVLSPEEKLEQIQEKKEEISEEEERLKQVIRQRERDQKLDELEDKLRDKQDRLDEMLAGDFVSREEAEQQALDLLSDRSGAWKDMSESEIRDTRGFESKVEKLVSTEEDVEELKKEVDRLQRRVAELNGGRENWFMELESMEVSV